jgi:hypothetical protein
MEYLGIGESLGQFIVDEKTDQIRSAEATKKNQG